VKWILALVLSSASCNQLLHNDGFTSNPCCGSGSGSGTTCGSCEQVDCASQGMSATTLTGTVYAPNGILPLANALVYVPQAPLAPLADGLAARACVSGEPLVSTRTGPDGTFVLENVPSGTNVPLVVQAGKWRREDAVVATVPACQTTPIDPSLTRLPRSASEGSLPHLAFATGSGDAIECLARDLGVDAVEISTARSSPSAHVHVYAGNGSPGFQAGPAFDSESELYSAARLAQYDHVFVGCRANPTTAYAIPTEPASLMDYVTAGGSLFLFHWQHGILVNGPAPWPSLGSFNTTAVASTPGTILVDTSTPDGALLEEWLVDVRASQAPGQVPTQSARSSCTGVDASQVQRSLYMTTPTPSVQSFTWSASGGGQLIYDAFHRSPTTAANTVLYPNQCNGAFAPEEMLILFQLFDQPLDPC
jgi:hypothetical protein